MNDSEINDRRQIIEFKGKTFSKFSRTKAKKALITSLYNSQIEPSCYWSIEFICAGLYQDLWEIILLYMSRYIQMGNPKLPIYVEMRFQTFKNIVGNGYIGNELGLRNNDKIRKLFAELICILCTSRKKHAFESLAIKDTDDFDLTNLTRKLKAPNIKFAQPVFLKDDPKELFIAVNEFSYHISKHSSDATAACYWLEWILQYENICKQKKIKCACERRSFAPVDDKNQMDIIWIIWDILIQEAANKSGKSFSKVIMALLNLFCIKFSTGCKKRRKYIIYFAISFLTEKVDFNITLVENKELIDAVTNKIYIIYKEVKKNELAPQTDYLYMGVEKSNIDKSVEKLERMNAIMGGGNSNN